MYSTEFDIVDLPLPADDAIQVAGRDLDVRVPPPLPRASSPSIVPNQSNSPPSPVPPLPTQRLSDASPDPLESGQQYAMMYKKPDPLIQAGGRGEGGAGGAAPKRPEYTAREDQEYGKTGNFKKFNFYKDEKKIGDMTLKEQNQGKDLYVGFANNFSKGDIMPWSKFIPQLRERFPDAERLYGLRISGVRSESTDPSKAYQVYPLKPGVSTKFGGHTPEESREIMRNLRPPPTPPPTVPNPETMQRMNADQLRELVRELDEYMATQRR